MAAVGFTVTLTHTLRRVPSGQVRVTRSDPLSPAPCRTVSCSRHGAAAQAEGGARPRRDLEIAGGPDGPGAAGTLVPEQVDHDAVDAEASIPVTLAGPAGCPGSRAAVVGGDRAVVGRVGAGVAAVEGAVVVEHVAAATPAASGTPKTRHAGRRDQEQPAAVITGGQPARPRHHGRAAAGRSSPTGRRNFSCQVTVS